MTSIFAGKMTCGARQISADEIQCYCRKISLPNRVVVNQVVQITDFGSFEWSYSDKTPGELDASIIWMFWKKQVPGPLTYQASVTINGIEGPAVNGQLAPLAASVAGQQE